MDFGKILDTWDKKDDIRGSGRKNMQKWLDEHGVEDKDTTTAHPSKGRKEKILERNELRMMKPQAQIDLHGYKAKEALEKLEIFLDDARKKGLKKVLVIHGKGIHSREEPVLGKAVRAFLENSPGAGEMGVAGKQDGGNGAVWVILRQRSL